MQMPCRFFRSAWQFWALYFMMGLQRVMARQCRLMARIAVAQGKSENFRVVAPERLGQKVFGREITLLVSFAAIESQQIAGWPFNDIGRLMPIFVGEWTMIHVFCSHKMSD